MPDTQEATGVFTASPVSPAQPLSQSATLSPITSAPSAADVSAMLAQERRIRDLQSQADQKRIEAERAAQEKTHLEHELESLRANQRTILDGAAAVANEALSKAQALEQRLAQAEAERMKAEALMEHPDLRPYAQFIPASTDAAALKQHIQAFIAARDQDLVLKQAQLPAAQPQPQPQAAQPNPYQVYPSGQQPQVPPAQPARPAANISDSSGVTAQIEEMMRQAVASGDPAKFEEARQKASQMVDALRAGR